MSFFWTAACVKIRPCYFRTKTHYLFKVNNRNSKKRGKIYWRCNLKLEACNFIKIIIVIIITIIIIIIIKIITQPWMLFTFSKTSLRRLGCRKIVTLKTSCWRLEDMSWRRLEDMSWTCLEDMSWRRYGDMFTGDIWSNNLNLNLTKLRFRNLYPTNSRQIQNGLIRTQLFRYSSYFETQVSCLFQEL